MSDAFSHLKTFLALPVLAVAFLFLLPACTDPDTIIEERFSEASQLVEEGNHDEAIPLLEELSEERPESADIAERLAFAYAATDRNREAADTFSRVVELAPERDDLLLFAAQAYEQAGDLDGAARHYEMFIVDNYDDFAGWQSLAKIERQRGRDQEAAEAYERTFELREDETIAAELGDLFLESGDIPRAAEWYERSLETGDGAEAAAMAGLFQISLEEENWTRALELAERLDANHPGHLEETGLDGARQELEEWKQTQEELERLRREREEEELRRREEQAREEAERLAREEEERRLEEEREREEAERLAREEEERRLAEEEAAEAEERLSPAEELAERASEARDERRLREAASLYWQALSHDDEDAEIWFELSRTLLSGRRAQQAESTALEAIRRDRENERYYLHYLNVIAETQPVRSYLRELHTARERFPENPDIVYLLAATYARGDWSQQDAARFYRRFLDMASGDDPRRSEAEEYLREQGTR